MCIHNSVKKYLIVSCNISTNDKARQVMVATKKSCNLCRSCYKCMKWTCLLVRSSMYFIICISYKCTFKYLFNRPINLHQYYSKYCIQSRQLMYQDIHWAKAYKMHECPPLGTLSCQHKKILVAVYIFGTHVSPTDNMI